MSQSNILKPIKDAFIGNALEENGKSIFTWGGYDCYYYLPFNFRFFQNFLMCCIYGSVIYYYLKNFDNRTEGCSKSIESEENAEPYLIEKILGYMLIAQEIFNMCLKLYFKVGIWMLNPCHITNVIVGIILTSKRTKKTFMLYDYIQSILWSLLIGIFIPQTSGIDGNQTEQILYHSEHWAPVIGIFIPFFCGRYRSAWFFNFKNFFFGMGCLVLYYNIILFVISEITWVNMVFNLCPSESDFLAAKLGKFYQIIESLMFQFVSILIRFGCLQICMIPDLFNRSDTLNNLKNKKD